MSGDPHALIEPLEEFCSGFYEQMPDLAVNLAMGHEGVRVVAHEIGNPVSFLGTLEENILKRR
jgi:hypothetical protein